MTLPSPQPTERIISLKRGLSPVLAPGRPLQGGRPTWCWPRINAYILADRAPYSSPVGYRGPQPAPACRTVSASGLFGLRAGEARTRARVGGGRGASRSPRWPDRGREAEGPEAAAPLS